MAHGYAKMEGKPMAAAAMAKVSIAERDRLLPGFQVSRKGFVQN